MQPTTAIFETRDGFIYVIRPKKPTLRVATAMKPLRVCTDARESLLAADVEASPKDRAPFTFRLLAREICNINTILIEQAVAWHGLECESGFYLQLFFKQNLPVESVVVGDLHYCEDEAANKFFRRLWNARRATKAA